MNMLFLYIFLFAGFFSNENPQLTLHVTNIETLKGAIVIGVFNTEKDFLIEGAAFKNYTMKVNEISKRLVIKDLPVGNYAISLYHDENLDNECNLNFFGIPKEGYGFSNNVKPKLSAPSFKDCKFSLFTDKVLDIKLIH